MQGVPGAPSKAHGSTWMENIKPNLIQNPLAKGIFFHLCSKAVPSAPSQMLPIFVLKTNICFWSGVPEQVASILATQGGVPGF